MGFATEIICVHSFCSCLYGEPAGYVRALNLHCLAIVVLLIMLSWIWWTVGVASFSDSFLLLAVCTVSDGKLSKTLGTTRLHFWCITVKVPSTYAHIQRFSGSLSNCTSSKCQVHLYEITTWTLPLWFVHIQSSKYSMHAHKHFNLMSLVDCAN